ncbi:metal-dependent hydrolase [Hyaloraphidium curvatum]|nr:metal-dependent hydrolase [Hyaloraphidium curvatum]
MAAPAQHADVIYVGNAITMVDGAPRAEAVAVSGGRILAVGPRAAVEAHKGPATEVHELPAGTVLLPGFVDPHSHFFNSLATSEQVNISAPPVGPCKTVKDIVEELKKGAVDLPGPDVLIGYGYDDSIFGPLTVDDLDPAFPDRPVLVMHVSLHGAVLNSAAMAKYGITKDTVTPEGGIIVRRPGSNEPLGLVMETAFLPVFSNLPHPGPEKLLELVKKGQMLYAAAGVTTAQEGATNLGQVEVLKKAAAAGALFIDVVSYPFIAYAEQTLAKYPAETFGKYENRLKLGGIKITMDGSPQGRTAYFTTPYLEGGPSGQENWCGEPTFSQDFFNGALKKCYDAGLQALFHANGDAAIDMVIKGHEYAAAGSLDKDRRSVVVHSQFVRKDQLQKYAEYKLLPTMYTEHTFFFMAAHVRNRGVEQASYISPMRDALDLGLRVTNHTDFSVLPIDQLTTVWSAVNRVDREGKVHGPDQCITPWEALKAITADAAHQYFEEDSKGTLEPGKLADLVVLDRDPLTVDPMEIKDIRVLETIKEGKTIYRRKE